jgi:hypothetical protein
MFCEEKERLVEGYNLAALAYSRAVHALNRKSTASPVPEYGRLREAVADTSAKCKEACLALKRHKTEHGCGPVAEVTVSPTESRPQTRSLVQQAKQQPVSGGVRRKTGELRLIARYSPHR